MSKRIGLIVTGVLVVAALGGCTAHPSGEQEERSAAFKAGKPFEKPIEQRQTPPLPDNPTPNDLVSYALLTNPTVEESYWDWRSAIEQIPQDGTQPTNLAISAGTTVDNGGISRDRTTLTALNDPMADIVWPEKLTVAAQRALENARAAGQRFQKAKFEIRHKVLSAYYDYALNAELIRLEEANSQLLQATAVVVESRNRTGAAGQQDVLKARNEVDLSRNDIANMQSQFLEQRATLNALLNRDIVATLPVPSQLPAISPVNYSDQQLLALATKQNPELMALASEMKGRNDAIRLAQLQYMPDFSISAGTDLAGVTQSLMGMVTIPLLRYQAIDAAIAQAEANLKSIEATRLQTANDLSAQIVTDIATLHDADRQLDLFENTILPRAQQALLISRSSYETGQSSLLDLLDEQRSLISIHRFIATLRITREKHLADIEAATVRILAQRTNT